MRMIEVTHGDCENLRHDQFKSALDYVSKKHSNKYKFILKGGKSLLSAIYDLFSKVWRTEVIPDVWFNSTLVQLYKGKGSINELDSMRYIHIKADIQKLFGQIVISAAKDNLIDNMSKFQIATKPGHRASEHLYVVMSVMELCERNGKAIIMTMYDLKKYFDSENLYDCMSELVKSNIRGKLYRLIFSMNQNIRIKVKTAVDETESEDIGQGVRQGTVDGAILSAVNLDNGVKEEFHKHNESIEDENEDKKVKKI